VNATIGDVSATLKKTEELFNGLRSKTQPLLKMRITPHVADLISVLAPVSVRKGGGLITSSPRFSTGQALSPSEGSRYTRSNELISAMRQEL